MPSVSSQFLYLPHSQYRPTFTAIFCDVIFAAFFRYLLGSPKIRTVYHYGPGNHRYFGTPLLLRRGGRNKLIFERFLTFLRTETTLILFTIILQPFIRAKNPIPTPISHLSTAKCTYSTSNGACAEEMASPAHGSDSSSSTRAKQQRQQE